MGVIKRIIILFMPGLILCFSGCGKNENKSFEITDVHKLNTTIDIMLPSGFYKPFIEKITPLFQKEYPGIKIKISSDSQLDTRLGANDPPNIYAANFGYQPVKYAKMGRLVNVEVFQDYKKLIKRIDPIYVRKIFGGYYDIPWNATNILMIYNKDLFERAGLDPNKPPVTMDEFLEYSKKITALKHDKDGRSIYGTALWNEALTWGGWYWESLAPMYYSMNHGKYQLLNKQQTTIAFNRPEAKMAQFLEFMKKAQGYAPKDMINQGLGFTSRRIGMWLQFGYGWRANLSEAVGHPMVIGKDVGVAPIPVPEKGDTSYTSLNGRTLLLFSSEPQKVLASWEFIKFLMRDDIHLMACKDIDVLPTISEVEKNKYFDAPDIKPFVDELKHSLLAESSPLSDQIQQNILNLYLRTVVLKNETIKAGIKNTAEKSINLFKEQE